MRPHQLLQPRWKALRVLQRLLSPGEARRVGDPAPAQGERLAVVGEREGRVERDRLGEERVGGVDAPAVQRLEAGEVQTIRLDGAGGLLHKVHRQTRCTLQVQQLTGDVGKQNARIGPLLRSGARFVGGVALRHVVEARGHDEGIADFGDLPGDDTAGTGLLRDAARVVESHAGGAFELRVAQQIEGVFVVHDMQVLPLRERQREHVERAFPQPVERAVGALHFEGGDEPLLCVGAAAAALGHRVADARGGHGADAGGDGKRAARTRRGRVRGRRRRGRAAPGGGGACAGRGARTRSRDGAVVVWLAEQRRGKGGAALEAVVGFLLEQAIHRVRDGVAHPVGRLLHRRYAFGEVLHENRRGRGRIDGDVAREQLIADESQRIEIAATVYRLSARLLGAHVAR